MATHSEPQRVLLPKSVQPLHYDLHFTPNLKDCTFHGKEDVEVNVKETTKTIVIHSQELKFTEASFVTCKGHVVASTSVTFHPEKDNTVTLEFAEALPVGKGSLSIEFNGVLNDSMMGFYRSKYTVNGEQRYVATTQFEPTGARKAFPCWDEPALKATFTVTITAPQDRTVLSNMEPTSETNGTDGTKTVKFAPTPIMSTYLLAFIVGEFEVVEGKTKEGTLVRVFTPLGKKSTGTFALDVGIKVLSYFNEYYGIPYPLKKCDHVAISDFSAGAMENWGLITYRETALLVDEQSGVATKQRVAYVVAHELAHQWFGNLVTMEWWKELWLNEGFATFVGNQAIAHLYPQWDIWTQFLSQYVNRALDLDGLENSHPIEVEVHSSAEIEEIFDIISYSKGASVIRMIADLLGEEKFRKGLNIYLNRHKFTNAVTTDLWKALEEASGFQVSEFMNTYTKVTGYPLLSIETANAQDGKYILSQRRYLQSGNDDTSGHTWWISTAISMPQEDPTNFPTLDLKFQKHATVTIPKAASHPWFKLNSGQSSFLRVKYSEDLLEKLSVAISKVDLPPLDRIGLQNDAFSLAKAGLMNTSKALLLAKGYVNEVDYTVWSDLLINLGGMANVWSNEGNYGDIEQFMRNLLKNIYKKLGWDPIKGESDLDTLLRSLVLNSLTANGDKDAVAECFKRFEAHLDGKLIPADFRFVVYSTVVASGGEKEYEQVYKLFKSADMVEEQLRALRALGYTKDVKLIQRTLELALSDEVRSQDIMYPIAGCAGNRHGREATWAFFKARFQDFKARVGESAMVFDRVIGFSIKPFTAEERADEIEKFFKENPVPNADRTIKQAIEGIRGNAKWLKNNREETAKWLAAHKDF